MVTLAAAFAVMGLFGLLIHASVPWVLPWQSFLVAAVFASLCVAGAVDYFHGRARGLRERTLEEAAERRRAEERLHESEERYRTLFDNVPLGLYRNQVRPHSAMTMANPAIVAMFGYEDEQEFLDAGGDDYFVDPADRAAWNEKFRQQGEAEAEELLFRRKDGTPFWGAVSATSVRNEAGEVVCVDGIVQDITRRKIAEQQRDEANRKLELLATTDGLTGLLNRRMVLERLEEELARCRRRGHGLAVVLTDLDHFKQVNDRHGHVAGDRVLAEVARRLKANCRPYDLAGRYGGEEFLLVLPEADANHARAVAERMRQLVADIPIPIDDARGLSVTASFGVAVSGPEAPEAIEALVARADAALYQAKEQGRNRVATAPAPSPPTHSPGAMPATPRTV